MLGKAMSMTYNDLAQAFTTMGYELTDPLI